MSETSYFPKKRVPVFLTDIALIFDELGQFESRHFFQTPGECNSFVAGFKLALVESKFRIYALPRDYDMMVCIENYMAIAEADRAVHT